MEFELKSCSYILLIDKYTFLVNCGELYVTKEIKKENTVLYKKHYNA